MCAWAAGCDKQLRSDNESAYCRKHATRAWKKDHPESVNEHNRRYNAKHPDDARAWRQKWLDANPGKSAEYAAARHARLRGQFVERVYRSVVFKRDRGLCGICRKAADAANWHLDHIVPLSRGGEHGYANVQVSHPFCNVSKGAKLIEYEVRLA